MMIRWVRFNIYLAIGVAIFLFSGCKTEKSQQAKVTSTMFLHQEINRDVAGRSEEVEVFRDHPVKLVVDKMPFLTDQKIKEAKVIETVGGFSLQIKLDRQGSWLLQQYTAASRGKHIAVYSQFMEPGEKKLNKGRWLAAPRLQNQINDGVFTFTPDATKEEAEQIALGLNNVAKKSGANDKYNW